MVVSHKELVKVSSGGRFSVGVGRRDVDSTSVVFEKCAGAYVVCFKTRGAPLRLSPKRIISYVTSLDRGG